MPALRARYGLIPTRDLGTGIADNTKFLRGDGVWASTINNLGGNTTRLGLSPGTSSSQGVLEVFSAVSISQDHTFNLFPNPGQGGCYLNGSLVLSSSGTVPSGNNSVTGTATGTDINAVTGLAVSAYIAGAPKLRIGASNGTAGTNAWAVGPFAVNAIAGNRNGIMSDGNDIIHNVPSGRFHYLRVSNTDLLWVGATDIFCAVPFRLTTSTPASAAATGMTGTISWGSSFIYVCIAPNTWKRVAIATW